MKETDGSFTLETYDSCFKPQWTCLGSNVCWVTAQLSVRGIHNDRKKKNYQTRVTVLQLKILTTFVLRWQIPDGLRFKYNITNYLIMYHMDKHPVADIAKYRKLLLFFMNNMEEMRETWGKFPFHSTCKEVCWHVIDRLSIYTGNCSLKPNIDWLWVWCNTPLEVVCFVYYSLSAWPFACPIDVSVIQS